jgi:Uma2 family endonuclease
MTAVLTAPDPQTRRWTRQEFHRLAELGFFDGQRAELLEGEIMVFSPQKAEHFTATDRVATVLRDAFGAGFQIRMQGPIELGPHSEPEPDVAVVPGRREDYQHQHPRTAVLIVEVSDTTLASDRTRKASLYARAGLADYWIVNLVDEQLEVYRDPTPDEGQPYGHRYATRTVLRAGETIAPRGALQLVVSVADLLGIAPP